MYKTDRYFQEDISTAIALDPISQKVDVYRRDIPLARHRLSTCAVLPMYIYADIIPSVCVVSGIRTGSI